MSNACQPIEQVITLASNLTRLVIMMAPRLAQKLTACVMLICTAIFMCTAQSAHADQATATIVSVETFDGRQRGKTYTGAWVYVSQPKIDGVPLSKSNFAFEFFGDYEKSHRGFGLSSVRTVSSLKPGFSSVDGEFKLGNRFFIDTSSISNLKKVVTTLERNDQEIVYAICSLMAQEDFIGRIIPLIVKKIPSSGGVPKEGWSKNKDFKKYWSNPSRLNELASVGQMCLRQMRKLIQFEVRPKDEPAKAELVESTVADSPSETKTLAETLAQQNRRKQCFSNKKVNISDQQLLSKLGFYKSKIDGVMGEGSKAAIVKAEKLLGPWVDDLDACLGGGERTILQTVSELQVNGAECVFGNKSKAEVYQLSNKLRLNGLMKESFGSFFPYQFAGFLKVVGKLENDLMVRGYYNSRGRKDCWLDQEEIDKLLLLFGNKKNGSIASAGTKPDTQAAQEQANGVKSTASEPQSCEANPEKCSLVELCERSTETVSGKKVWKSSNDAASYVEVALSIGLKCGVSAEPLVEVKAPTCNEDPALCSVVQLCQKATEVTDGKTAWASTRDASLFVELAKATGLQCSVPKELPAIEKAPSCDDDPVLCTVAQLCQKSTELIEGRLSWINSGLGLQYVDLAKSNGLDCNVAPEPEVAEKLPSCDDDPALCSVVQLCDKAVSLRDDVRKWAEDEGLRAYTEAAKAAGLTCGVEPVAVVKAEEPTCETDVNLCSLVELCAVSTSTDGSGAKSWKSDPKLSEHVQLAKQQGVSCGVVDVPIVAQVEDNCDNKPSLCSLAELCRKSISYETGSLDWTTDPSLLKHVDFAKKAGISCGVSTSASINQLIREPVKTSRPEKERSLGEFTKRRALVIGNSQYTQQVPLKNPKADAELVARSLEAVGFEVELAFDLTRRDLGRAITSFSSRTATSDISLFYFAGHGVEIEGRNYLIPTDAIMDDPSALKYDVIDLEEAINSAAGSSKLSLVMVDACRDNPFQTQLAGLNRSLSRGLKVIETDAVSKNQIVSFAAESGRVADDGDGGNSPYAKIFSELVVQPNLEVGKMFRQLSDRVSQITDGRQTPVSRNRLSGDDIFFLIER